MCLYISESHFASMYARWTFLTSRFSATHWLDIKILQIVCLLVILKGAIIKLKLIWVAVPLLSDHLHLYSRGWIWGSHTKYIWPPTHSTYLCKYVPAPLWTYTYIHVPMVNLQPYTYVYTCTYIHTSIHILTPTRVSTHMRIHIARSIYYHTSVAAIQKHWHNYSLRKKS